MLPFVFVKMLELRDFADSKLQTRTTDCACKAVCYCAPLSNPYDIPDEQRCILKHFKLLVEPQGSNFRLAWQQHCERDIWVCASWCPFRDRISVEYLCQGLWKVCTQTARTCEKCGITKSRIHRLAPSVGIRLIINTFDLPIEGDRPVIISPCENKFRDAFPRRGPVPSAGALDTMSGPPHGSGTRVPESSAAENDKV